MDAKGRTEAIRHVPCAKCKGNLLRCNCGWPPTLHAPKWELYTTEGKFLGTRYTYDSALLASEAYSNRWDNIVIREVTA